jgi:hypothetical protein
MPAVEYTLGGQRLSLVLNFNALAAFERHSGRSALREWTWATLSATELMYLLYATANRWDWKDGRQVLLGDQEIISLRELGEAINYSTLEPTREVLAKLYEAAWPPEGERKGGGAGSGSDPQSASPSPGEPSGPSDGTTSDSPNGSSGA